MRLDGSLRKHGFEPTRIVDIAGSFMIHGQVVSDGPFLCEFLPHRMVPGTFDEFPQLTVLGPPRISVYIYRNRTCLATLLPSRLFRMTLPSLMEEQKRKLAPFLREFEARLRRVLRDLSGNSRSGGGVSRPPSLF